MFAFSDGCCPKIDYYLNGIKQSEDGSFIVQAEKVNGNCHYKQEGDDYGLWMCEDSWWAGELPDKQQCKGDFHASTDSKTNISLQNDSLQWKDVQMGRDYDLMFKCVDLCL